VNEPFRSQWSPRETLRERIAFVWADRSANSEPLLPDAAVELVWSGRGLFVRGADTRPHLVGSFPDRTFVGLRFRPGAAADVLGLRGRELADARVGISELWGRSEMERLESALDAAPSPRATANVLEAAVASRVRNRPDCAVEAVVHSARNVRGALRVAALAEAVGLSERQLLRRCTDAFGYGPKTLQRIFRFQRFRALAERRPDAGLAWLAAASGYADQAHLTRECRRLARTTPRTFIARV
jgi:AraC-like DNA-binding protein